MQAKVQRCAGSHQWTEWRDTLGFTWLAHESVPSTIAGLDARSLQLHGICRNSFVRLSYVDRQMSSFRSAAHNPSDRKRASCEPRRTMAGIVSVVHPSAAHADPLFELSLSDGNRP